MTVKIERAHGRLLLNILGSIAEFERELIKARTSEGRARAKLRNVRFGRPPALSEYQKLEALRRREAGEVVAGHNKQGLRTRYCPQKPLTCAKKLPATSTVAGIGSFAETLSRQTLK